MSTLAADPEKLQELVALVKDVDSVELKVTVPEPAQLSTVRALGLDPLQAQIRQVFFLEAPDLALDASPEGFVCSASLKNVPAEGDVRKAAGGERAVRKLFSREQQELFAEHAPEGTGLDDLTMLGPLFVLKLKFSPEGFDRKMVTELWLYPDGSRLLELSTKCEPSEVFDVAAQARTFLTSRGIDLDTKQQTKTRSALEFFTKQLGNGAKRKKKSAAK